MLLEGIAGRFLQMARGALPLSLTGMSSLRVAQMEGEGDEATRAGIRFVCRGATQVLPAQAAFTTNAHWLLWNPVGNNTTAYIDVLGAINPTSTVGTGATLWACPVPTRAAPATVPTVSQASVLVLNCNPASTRTSKLILIDSQTLYGVDRANWSPVAFMNPNQTAIGQGQMEQRDLRGKLLVPPGCGLALGVIGPVAGGGFTPYIVWREYASDNES